MKGLVIELYGSMRKGIRSVCDQLVSLLKPEAHQGTIKYAAYKSGVLLKKISVNDTGLKDHLAWESVQQLRDDFPNAAANVDKAVEYICGVLGKVAAKVGKAIVGSDGLPIFLNPGTDPELFEYAREMGEVRVQYVVENIIVPILEAVDAWAQDMTPQQKIFVDFIDKASFVFGAGAGAVSD